MPLVHVEFKWDDRLGVCYGCGLPAAFATPDAYGPNPEGIIDAEHKHCAVCAANAAVDGERIVRIEPEE